MESLDIVNDYSFIVSRNKCEVIESLYSVIYKLTADMEKGKQFPHEKILRPKISVNNV